MLSGCRIALIEDDEIMGASLYQRLGLEGAEVIWLKQMRRALGALRTPRAPIDLVVCDIRLSDGTGEELFTTLCRTHAPPPFLFITGQGSIGQAVRLLQAGASDYIAKPFDMREFLEKLVALAPARPMRGEALLGISAAALRIETRILEAATRDDPVLILAARGTGKRLLAERIHARSARADGPFAVLDIEGHPDIAAALRATLARAEAGTAFLNGVEHLPGAEQDALIAALGVAKTRVIAAAGPGLAAAAREGRFRGDLHARLSGLDIAIPPLKDRPEDAVWLLSRMFESLNARRAAPLRPLSALVLEAVRAHDWPQNGRELRGRLVKALAAVRGDTLYPADLFPERALAPDDSLPSLSEARDAAERAHILRALERTGGQVGEAAKLLQVSRTTLWEKMQKLGL